MTLSAGPRYDAKAGREEIRIALNEVCMAACAEGLCAGVDKMTRMADVLVDAEAVTQHEGIEVGFPRGLEIVTVSVDRTGWGDRHMMPCQASLPR